jgi:hypothetical protein
MQASDLFRMGKDKVSLLLDAINNPANLFCGEVYFLGVRHARGVGKGLFVRGY